MAGALLTPKIGTAARPAPARGRARSVPRYLFAVALAARVGFGGPAGAQQLRLADMDRASWTARDGAPQGMVVLERTPDGRLWLGTPGGLYVFDGRTFTAFQSPAGEPQLPAAPVRSLLTTRDGTLWVGFLSAPAARIANGRVTLYDVIGKQAVSLVEHFAEARDGTVWALLNQTTLIRFGRGDTAWRVQATPREVADTRMVGLHVDSYDVLWLSHGGRLFRRQLPETTYTAAEVPADWVSAFAETPGGDIWMSDYEPRANRGRLQRFDRWGRRLAALSHPSSLGAILRTRDGSLIVSIDGRLQQYAEDSLMRRSTFPPAGAANVSGDAREPGTEPGSLLLDPDDNLWVTSRRALIRLRAPRLVPFRAGMSDSPWTMCADARGDLFVGSRGAGLFRVAGERSTRIPGSDLVRTVSCGRDGVVRMLDIDKLWEVRGDRLEEAPSIPGAPPVTIRQIVATSDHTLYAMAGGSLEAFGGVWQFVDGRWTKIAAKGQLRRPGLAYVDSRNRLWIGYRRGLIGRPLEGLLLSSGTPGLDDVSAFLETRRGFFAGGGYGLAVLRDTSFQLLAFADAAATRGVGGLVESRNGDLWLNAAQGIVRLPAAELEAGLANPRYRMRTERITEGDFTGPAIGMTGKTAPTAARAPDGTLWFGMLNGAVRYDPDAPHPGGKAPILSIRSITADRVPLGARRTFGPQPRTLAIEYFGVHLAAPDRVRYRYKLDGFDDAWHDAGGRTEAIYTRPGPGTYTFRVMAATEAGVWSAPVASAPFTVLPTFYQTRWFAALAVGTAVALAWLAYSLRVRTITALVQARAEERADERVRIARELHDTLLSGMAGIMTGLGAAARRARAPGAVDAEALDTLYNQTRRMLVEAREAVVAMRTSTDALTPLTARLEGEADRIFRGAGTEVRVAASGTPRPLPPGVDAQVMRVAAEAMTNARAHADCRTVEVTCAYAPREFTLRVRDDGRGFDPAVAGVNGHYGLVGMRERAAAIGAGLTVTSAPGHGTEVALAVPADAGRRAAAPVRAARSHAT